jgi:hypothetical protein
MPSRQVYKSRARRAISQVLALVGIALALFTFQQIFAGHRRTAMILGVAWALGPPLWFIVEFYWVFDNWESEDAVASWKHIQRLTATFWAAVGAVLAAAYAQKGWFSPFTDCP